MSSTLICLGVLETANVPRGIATFFTVMTIAEGGGRRAVSHKLRDMYLPTLKANFMVWPLVQIINFRIMPIQFQLVSPSPMQMNLAHFHLSPLSLPSVLLGQHISHSLMLQRMLLRLDPLPNRPISDCYKNGFGWIQGRNEGRFICIWELAL